MKHIPFAAFAAADRLAVAEAFGRNGVPVHGVCVSQLEWPDPGEGLAGVTFVSAPGWVGRYATGAGWCEQLADDLGALRAG